MGGHRLVRRVHELRMMQCCTEPHDERHLQAEREAEEILEELRELLRWERGTL